MIFVVKVITNKEDQAAELIADRVRKKKLEVYSVVRPHGLRGYLMVEALDREVAEQATLKLPYVKGVLAKSLTYAEIEKMVEPVTTEMNI